jgi:hypothetical protein
MAIHEYEVEIDASRTPKAESHPKLAHDVCDPRVQALWS